MSSRSGHPAQAIEHPIQHVRATFVDQSDSVIVAEHSFAGRFKLRWVGLGQELCR